MAQEFPFEFTLASGTQVVVHKAEGRQYNFHLKGENGEESSFSYDHGVTFTEEMEKALTFDELNALRLFWLELEKDELT